MCIMAVIETEQMCDKKRGWLKASYAQEKVHWGRRKIHSLLTCLRAQVDKGVGHHFSQTAEKAMTRRRLGLGALALGHRMRPQNAHRYLCVCVPFSDAL